MTEILTALAAFPPPLPGACRPAGLAAPDAGQPAPPVDEAVRLQAETGLDLICGGAAGPHGTPGAGLDGFLAALRRYGIPPSRGFVPVWSPGALMSRAEPGHCSRPGEFPAGLTAALRRQCEAVAAAGLAVQVIAPDLASGPPGGHGDSWDEAEAEAINQMTDGIGDVAVRVGPQAQAAAVTSASRHLRPGCLVIAGAGALRCAGLSCGGWPLPGRLRLGAELRPGGAGFRRIADDLVRVACAVGPARVVLAAADCGYPGARPYEVQRQLRALVEGAEAASWQLSCMADGIVADAGYLPRPLGPRPHSREPASCCAS